MNTPGLADLFARYPPWVAPLGEIEALGGAGGLSGARLYRHLSAGGRLVTRRWPDDGPDQARLGLIHGWLARAADLEFIPNPIPDQKGATLQAWAGGLWEVAPWLEGKAHLVNPPDQKHLVAAATALARFHTRLADLSESGRSPGLKRRLETVFALLGGGFDLLEAAVQQASTRSSADLDILAARWLHGARALAPLLVDPLRRAADRVTPLAPCLRDARPEHFLFLEAPSGPRVSGLVDFGAMDVDSVAGDLARLFSEGRAPADPARSAAIDAYRAIRPLKPDQVDLIASFEQSAALLGGERWIRWHYLEGRQFDDPGAAADGLRRALERLTWLAREGLGPGLAAARLDR